MKVHIANRFENFIAAWTPENTDICDTLIEYFKSTPDKGPGTRGGVLDINMKNSTDCNIRDSELLEQYLKYLNSVTEKYCEMYSACTKFSPWAVIEPINIQHYEPGGGYYAWHTERTNAMLPASARTLVFMTYLNTVTDGGETEWYHQKLKIKPERGLTVIWPADWCFAHRGITSMTQDKYIVTGWFSYTA